MSNDFDLNFVEQTAKQLRAQWGKLAKVTCNGYRVRIQSKFGTISDFDVRNPCHSLAPIHPIQIDNETHNRLMKIFLKEAEFFLNAPPNTSMSREKAEEKP